MTVYLPHGILVMTVNYLMVSSDDGQLPYLMASSDDGSDDVQLPHGF